jgi:SCO1/SenC
LGVTFLGSIDAEVTDVVDGRFGAAVLSFVYTHCTDTCPLLTATVAQVQDRLRAEGLLGSRVQLMSVTVDPRRTSLRSSPTGLIATGHHVCAQPKVFRGGLAQPIDLSDESPPFLKSCCQLDLVHAWLRCSCRRLCSLSDERAQLGNRGELRRISGD